MTLFTTELTLLNNFLIHGFIFKDIINSIYTVAYAHPSNFIVYRVIVKPNKEAEYNNPLIYLAKPSSLFNENITFIIQYYMYLNVCRIYIPNFQSKIR